MWERIRSYLTFTRKERLGVLVLLFIILVLFIAPYLFGPETGSPDPQAYQKYQEGIRKFQSAGREGPAEKTNTNGINGRRSGPFTDQLNKPTGPLDFVSEKTGSGEMKNRPASFYFDPNRISADDWRRLGLPDKLILTISHYIQKGGIFRTPADLKKLYGLKTEEYERLFPYVRIREPPNQEFHSAAAYHPSKRNRNFFERGKDSSTSRYDKPYLPAWQMHAYSIKKPEDLDINQADSSIWCRFPGIGIKLASRIVHFREKLGGFYSVDQLHETFGLPDSTFQQIRPFLHISSPGLQKIDLNTADREILQAHPYIGWKLAREIILFREQHGGFRSAGELQQLVQMDPEKYKKLEPYLEVK
ncbi:MAG TPA: helix-hairpin-helix domain-containing protein [Puia sp.]